MREIVLNGPTAASLGLTALVDDADFEAAAAFRWYPQRRRTSGVFSAMRHIVSPRKHSTEFLHRFLMGVPGVDHADGNPLNNQRSNLRIATPGQNAANAGKRQDARTSAFKGVHWRSRSECWVAQIQSNRGKRHIGYFTDEVAAARAYDDAALACFGEFARLNFPGESD